MNIAVSTTCSDGYAVFLDHLIKSILEYNPKFDRDFVVFCDPRLCEQNRIHLKTIYPKFIFKDVDYYKYQEKNKANMKFYSIECFNLEYDRIIYWGSDMLCLNKLDSLLKLAEDIKGVAMPKENRRGSSTPFNNGSMIVGQEYLNKDTYEDLLNADFSHKPEHLKDQKLYNYFFEGKIQKIDLKYNVLVSEIDWVDWDDIVLLHYIYKPTVDVSIKNLNKIDPKLYKIWAKYDDPEGRYKRLIC
jgi:lipopolysaccharide biosynthesis glycosyltransferase